MCVGWSSELATVFLLDRRCMEFRSSGRFEGCGFIVRVVLSSLLYNTKTIYPARRLLFKKKMNVSTKIVEAERLI